MHYLTALSAKLASAYNNQESVLSWSQRKPLAAADPSLLQALQAVLEEEVENGHLRYNLLRGCGERLETAESQKLLFADFGQP